MKNKRNKNKGKMLLSILVIFVVLIGITLQGINGNNEVNNSVSETGNLEQSDDWEKALKSDTKQLIYLGRPTCSWCNKIRPELDNMRNKYGIDFVYINTDETSESDLNFIFEKLEIDADEFGTPYLVVIENSKKIDEQVGYIPEEQLFEFYKKNGLVEKN